MIAHSNGNGHSADNGHSVIVPSTPTHVVREMCRVFYRHRRKMAVVFCGMLALLVAGLMMLPRSYTSEARLFIRLGKESVSLDPVATMNEVINVHESRESEINSELEIIRSRTLLADVVKQLGAETIVPHSAESGWGNAIISPARRVSRWLSGENGTPEERAVAKLNKAIEVTSPRKSNVLVVTCKAGDPKVAQRILAAFLGAYRVRHAEANRTFGSYDFFANQADLIQVELLKNEQELRDTKSQNGIASIDGERKNLEDQSNALHVAMFESQRALVASNARMVALEKMLNDLPKHETEESAIPSEGFENMRNEMYKVSIEEKDLSSRYTGNHPQVIAARRKVDELRSILASENPSHSQPTRKASVVYQTVHADMAATQATSAAHTAEAELLERQISTLQAKIQKLNEQELRVKHLMREIDLLDARYRTFTTNRDHARADAALATGEISNINIVQPPSYVAKASGPNMRLAIALALILATLTSILVALISEQFDQSLRSPEQTEQALGIPVLFCVPRGERYELAKN